MAPRSRIGKADWVKAAFDLLRAEGERSLTIDRLCTALDRSKGSFYHHFGDLDGFVDATLAEWVEAMTVRPIREARAEPDPQRQAAALAEIVRGLDHHLDVAIRAWGLRDPRVRRVVKEVDDQRIDCLTAFHQVFNRRRPRLLAEIEYAAFVGAQATGMMASRRAQTIDAALQRALKLLDADESFAEDTTS